MFSKSDVSNSPRSRMQMLSLNTENSSRSLNEFGIDQSKNLNNTETLLNLLLDNDVNCKEKNYIECDKNDYSDIKSNMLVTLKNLSQFSHEGFRLNQ